MWSILSFVAWLAVALVAVGGSLKLYVWGRRAFLATVGPRRDDVSAASRVARLDGWAMRLLYLSLGVLAVVVVIGLVGSYLLQHGR